MEKDVYFTNTQEVGLEAAILERKRNSSLAERYMPEDVTGLNMIPKLGVQLYVGR